MATAEKDKGRRRRFQSIHSGWEFTCGRQEKSFFLPPSPHLCLCVNLSLSCGGNSFDLMAQWDLILRILYFLIGSYLQSPKHLELGWNQRCKMQRVASVFLVLCMSQAFMDWLDLCCLPLWSCAQVLEMQKILENQHKLQKPEQESKTHPSMQHY